jgi:Lon-like ATP-dependent protease
MEIIKLSGYLIDEKLAIAKNHLLPQLKNDTALKTEQIDIEDDALLLLISDYCREAGVRSLQKHLEKIFRKVAFQIANGSASFVKVTSQNLPQFAGKQVFQSDRLYTTPPPGVATGLAWNTLGGALVCIEVVVVSMNQIEGPNGKNQGRLKATGKLGDVMKESIEIAYTFARNFTFQQNPDNKFFDQATLHIHFPEGAIAKDGPSAGCAIVTALVSLMLNKVVNPDVAMTGEITLTGMVLPVGGIKEKIMAAKRSNIKSVILPELNKRDFDELSPQLKSDLNVHFVKQFKDVYNIVFH